MAPDQRTAVWQQWRDHTARLTGVDRVQFGSLRASQIAALHAPTTARTLSQRYLLPLELLDIRLAQKLADERFPNSVHIRRLNDDGSERSTQDVDRLPVESATADVFSFLTPYQAGPWIHETTLDTWSDTTGDIEIPVLDDGSMVFPGDLTSLDHDVCRQLAADAIDFRSPPAGSGGSPYGQRRRRAHAAITPDRHSHLTSDVRASWFDGRK